MQDNDPLLKVMRDLDANPIKRQALLEALRKVNRDNPPASPEQVQALKEKFER